MRVAHEVHPRIRGEYNPTWMSRTPHAGSPPHTRGILLSVFWADLPTRFTPAYAGNTWAARLNPISTEVHPRIRGEYLDLGLILCRELGSPPHTRGILVEISDCGQNSGFTPAYAGNTLIAPAMCPGMQVHPRIRGEYGAAADSAVFTAGSPPHTRGILPLVIFGERIKGFTPAYAGNTEVLLRSRSHA